jgi:cyclopropane-fatty-acyl-phospholipid synthase
MSRFHYNIVSKALKSIEGGTVQLFLPDQTSQIFGDNTNNSEKIDLQINDWKVFKLVLSRGDIGFAEGYMQGLWTTNNLEGVLRLALKNRTRLSSLIYGSWWGSISYKIKHLLHRNTRSGSKKNIHAHYDLGNEFYSLWLDPSMMYSSALFGDQPHANLSQAQEQKCARILDQLKLVSRDKILEIGCGWGSFIQRAINNQLNIIGLTISEEQKKYIDQKFKSDSIEIKLQDYRDANDLVDGIVSIEMFEAVGESYWPSYFETVARCLKNGKRAVIQTIVIQDDLFEKYRHETDFIQQYVFPGGMLPSKSIFKVHAEKSGLNVLDEFSFGEDYAKTLRIWGDAFNAKLEQIRHLGFKDEFIRLWNFYLMYCAAGFAEKSIDVIQFTLEKPQHAT